MAKPRQSKLAKLADKLSSAPTPRAQDLIADGLDALVLSGHFEAALHAMEALASGPLAVSRKSCHSTTISRLAPMVASVLGRAWPHGGEPPAAYEASVWEDAIRDTFTQFPPPGERSVEALIAERRARLAAEGQVLNDDAQMTIRITWIMLWRAAIRDARQGELASARGKIEELLARYGEQADDYIILEAQILLVELALRQGDRDAAIVTLRAHVARGDTRWNGRLFALSRPMRLLSEQVLQLASADDARAFVAAIDARVANPPASAPALDWKKLLRRKRKPATKQAIAALEARIGRSLPPSYRSFLEASDGAAAFEDILPELLPTRDVRWFREQHQDWIDTWTREMPGDASDAAYFVYGDGQDSTSLRTRYLQGALQIGSAVDGAVYLLVPDVIDARGEWEAWLFANWLPGADRYPSFRELVEATSSEAAT